MKIIEKRERFTHKNLRRINPTEHEIQAAIVEWAYLYEIPFNGLKLRDLLIKIPNEGKRSQFIGNKMKKEGLRRGVSDLFLAFPSLVNKNGDFHKFSGLWIEVKSLHGVVSKEQKLWAEIMMLVGYRVVLVRTIESGIQAIKEYLGMK